MADEDSKSTEDEDSKPTPKKPLRPPTVGQRFAGRGVEKRKG